MTQKLTHGSVFSGVGGLDMAVEEFFGAKTIWQCEIGEAQRKVLARRFPDAALYEDITKTLWEFVPRVDIISGGFPCQDLSVAGKKAGIAEGTRSGLWSHMCGVIDFIRPRYVVIENVRGLLSSKAKRGVGFEQQDLDHPLRAAGAVLGDLADIGYDARWETVRASSAGSPHRRERVIILATPHTPGYGWPEGRSESAGIEGRSGTPSDSPTPADSEDDRFQWGGQHGSGGRDLRTTLTDPASIGFDWRGPASGQAEGTQSAADRRRPDVAWGEYGPAIERWERVLGRQAPVPTEPNSNGNPRLNAAFSEWMMGWPAGWVTDFVTDKRSKKGPTEISRSQALTAIGGGVVPQQAILALEHLTQKGF